MMNNLGNLRPVGSSSGFQSYNSPEDGIAAMRNDLLVKLSGRSGAMKARYGENYAPNLASLITTYAPPTENNTDQYIRNVAQWTGIDPNQPLQPQDVERLLPAMIKQENGQKGVETYNQYAQDNQAATDALPEGFQLDAAPAANGLPEGFQLDAPAQEMVQNAPKSANNESSFLGDMKANAENAVHSARDLLSGNFEDIGRTVSTPKTTNLTDKLFPSGSDGSIMDAVHNVRNTAPSDWSGALLEKFGNTAEGKALSAIGGLHPLYNAAGTAVSRYVNPAIEDATGIAPDNLALLELASSTLGLKQAKNAQDPLVSAAKAAGGKLTEKLSPKAALPTSADVRAGASSLYSQAEALGGDLKPVITDKWINSASSVLPQTPAGKTVLGETSVSKLVDRLQNLKGNKLTLAEAQEIDSALGDMMNSEVHPQTGKLNAEGNKILKIQQELRDTIEAASPSDVVGGKAGFDAWKQGRSEWSKAARMNEIERIMSRAEGADNPATVLKNGFRTLKNNPKRMRGYSDAEKAAISHAAKTGVVGGALKFGGSRLISSLTGAISGGAGGGPLGAAFGAAGGAAIGSPMRAAAGALQRGRAENVLRTIASPTQAPGTSLATYASQGAKALPGTATSGALAGLIDQAEKTKTKGKKK